METVIEDTEEDEGFRSTELSKFRPSAEEVTFVQIALEASENIQKARGDNEFDQCYEHET